MDLEYDYYFISPKRKIIINYIAEFYFEIKGENIPFCEINDKTIKKYVTNKDEKKKDLSFSRMSVTGLSNVKDFTSTEIKSNNFNKGNNNSSNVSNNLSLSKSKNNKVNNYRF